MSGAIDPVYVGARNVLLNALAALGPQCKAVILVGAQAIYLHTGAVDFSRGRVHQRRRPRQRSGGIGCRAGNRVGYDSGGLFSRKPRRGLVRFA